MDLSYSKLVCNYLSFTYIIITFYVHIFQISCRLCKCKFANRSELFKHRKIHHSQVGYGLHNMPFTDEDAPWLMSDGTVNIPLKEEYILNKDIILQDFEEGW